MNPVKPRKVSFDLNKENELEGEKNFNNNKRKRDLTEVDERLKKLTIDVSKTKNTSSQTKRFKTKKRKSTLDKKTKDLGTLYLNKNKNLNENNPNLLSFQKSTTLYATEKPLNSNVEDLFSLIRKKDLSWESWQKLGGPKLLQNVTSSQKTEIRKPLEELYNEHFQELLHCHELLCYHGNKKSLNLYKQDPYHFLNNLTEHEKQFITKIELTTNAYSSYQIGSFFSNCQNLKEVALETSLFVAKQNSTKAETLDESIQNISRNLNQIEITEKQGWLQSSAFKGITPNVKSIMFSCCLITSGAAKAFFSKSSSSLEALDIDLAETTFPFEVFEKIYLPNLKGLSLTDYTQHITNDNFCILLSTCYKTLTHLEITELQITKEAFPADFATLENLSIIFCDFSNDTMSSIFSRCSSTLMKLKVEINPNLSSHAFTNHSFPKLKNLILTCDLKSEDIAPILSTCSSTLEELSVDLDLDFTKKNPVTVDSLPDLPKIKKIFLEFTDISHWGIVVDRKVQKIGILLREKLPHAEIKLTKDFGEEININGVTLEDVMSDSENDSSEIESSDNSDSEMEISEKSESEP